MLRVHQGCPLSPILFNYAIDWVMIKAIAEYRGVQLSSDIWISDIEYAEDVVNLAENLQNLNFLLENVNYFLILLDCKSVFRKPRSSPLARQLAKHQVYQARF